jgi:signal transduction histidine kinase
VVLVLLSAVAVGSLVRLQRNQQQVTSTIFQAVTRSSDLLTSLLDQETGLRGYALAGDDQFLKPYTDGVRDQKQELADLRRILHDQAAVLAKLAAVEGQVEDWRASTAVPLQQQVRAGTPITPAQLDASKAAFDGIRASFESYRSALLKVRSAAYDRMRAATYTLFGVVAVLVLLIIGAGIALWAALRRWVTGPLDQLGAEVAVVTGGELGHGVEVTGPDEVTSLGAEVDSMRRRIVHEYAAALEARAVAQDALAVVEDQKADLERSNTELEQFAYVASHDLQEPLRKVASFCQLLEKRYGDQLDERGHQYIEFAVDGAKRMQALINDLLAFSRVGRLSEGAVDVDLGAVLDGVLRSLELLIEETGAVVTHDPLPTLPGEPALLAALLQNLVGNGVKFHGAEPPRVHLSATRTGEMWEITCADNGIGVEAKYADKIFVIFQRLHARDEYSGTGIGLALCRKIVEHHGGRIWLDLDVAAAGDRGTTFRFTLPAVRVERPSLDGDDGDTRASNVVPATSTPGGAHA